MVALFKRRDFFIFFTTMLSYPLQTMVIAATIVSRYAKNSIINLQGYEIYFLSKNFVKLPFHFNIL